MTSGLPAGIDRAAFETWQRDVRSGALSLAGNIVVGELEPPPAGAIVGLPSPASPAWEHLHALGRSAIADGQLGVCILNGGMATRFGGIVKGLLEVFPGRSLLELKLRDVAQAERRYGGPIRVIMMNSFNTGQATLDFLGHNRQFGLDAGFVRHLCQTTSLRMDAAGEVFVTSDGRLSPYSPGHGELFSLLRSTGALHDFRAAGGRYLLVSCIDNVAARVSPLVLGHHIACDRPVTVEVAPRHPGDVGGAPLVHRGAVEVVEHLRYPAGFDPGTVDLSTNTMTFTASELEAPFDLDCYYIEKPIEGRRAVQIERLLCDITSKLGANYVRVPRDGPHTRFVPLKVPEDLTASRPVLNEMLATVPS